MSVTKQKNNSSSNSTFKLSHHLFKENSMTTPNIDHSHKSTSKYTNKLSTNKAPQGSPVSARDFFFNNDHDHSISENEFVMGNDERLSLGTRIKSSKKVR